MSMRASNYSVFTYLYRDAGNYKVPGLLLLLGTFTAAHDAAIRSACDGGELFVSEQVCISTLYAELYIYSNGPTIDDHGFHEFHGLRSATRDDALLLPLWGSLDDLVARFRAVQYWDCTRSQHCR